MFVETQTTYLGSRMAKSSKCKCKGRLTWWPKMVKIHLIDMPIKRFRAFTAHITFLAILGHKAGLFWLLTVCDFDIVSWELYQIDVGPFGFKKCFFYLLCS